MTQPNDAIGDANSGMAAAVPAHACTDGAGASPVGARKLLDLVERGHAVIGHILHKEGQYALFDGSCRWLTKPQYQRLMHEQDGSLFGATTAYHTAKLRAAIADARHVFGGERLAEDVLHYLEQVLAAGAPVPAQTGITPGAENASTTKETHTPLGAAPMVVAGADPFRAAARQAVMWQAGRDGFEQEAAALSDATKIASPMRSKFDHAAAAMAAESAKKVADAEWFASRCTYRAPAPVDAASTPTTVGRMVVEVDTTALDATLAKAEQLKVALAGLAPRAVLS